MEPDYDIISEMQESLKELAEERDLLRFRIETKDKIEKRLLRRLRLKDEAFEAFKLNASNEKDELEEKIEELIAKNTELTERYQNLYDTLELSDDPDVA